MSSAVESTFVEPFHINEEYIKSIFSKLDCHEENTIENFSVQKASEKMLGFLCEYWKVKVFLSNNKVVCFFIKSISRSNEAKANMVKEMKLFDKEVLFYNEIKKNMDAAGKNIKPWSARKFAILDDALVFEDLNAAKYKLRNKFDRFDMEHTIQALNTLARFHASSIIYEENRSKESHMIYRFDEEFEQSMDRSGYQMASEWFLQCMRGALDALKAFSHYSDNEMKIIEANWRSIWETALNLSDPSPKQRNVICHRDLWNNNIMFHYSDIDGRLEPDDCVFVDFQAIRYQPPASDVMLLLCCNLDPKFRKKNLKMFLNHYYGELQRILSINGVNIEDVINKQDFFSSAEDLRQFGLVLCACLMPQFWIDDDLTTKIFTNNDDFDEILSKNKGMFIREMMESNRDYKEKVMEIFLELADRYCLQF